MVASKDNFPLLAELLAEQQRLATPVAQFSAAHDSAPALEPVYRDLIPLSAPKAGEQYAFEVELDSCTGCKACVSACHSLNGLDEHETWRDVGLLVGADDRRPFQQIVTTACHHCADPACLDGCPVLAYEKDPVTGIVRHLDDQCIGCQYCILKCPYDVPKYNARLGIVRKCDMCHGRLAAGEAPACVQACPTHAIRIVARAVPAVEETFLPGAAERDYTRPTTRYVSRRGLPGDLRPADAFAQRVQPAHWPLVWVLTLLPMAIGCHGAVALRANGIQSDVTLVATLTGIVLGATGLVVSGCHLGQPLRAWRVFLGWRKSWLSREAMILGAWLPIAIGVLIDARLAAVSFCVGVLGLICSAMIYADTRRAYWRASHAVVRILGTVTVAGTMVAMLDGAGVGAAAGLIATMLLKLGCDARVMRSLDEIDEDDVPHGLAVSARVLRGPLRAWFGARIVMAIAGAGTLSLLALERAADSAWGMAAVAMVLGGELIERMLFFRAVDAPKMPGVPG